MATPPRPSERAVSHTWPARHEGFALERHAAERRQAAEHAVTRCLAEATDVAEALRQVLRVICEHLDFHVGQLWQLEGGDDVLRCTDHWLTDERQRVFVEHSSRLTFARGVGMPGRVWASRTAHWIEDVVREPNFPRAPVAAQAGLHAAVGFPIIIDGAFFGCVEFFGVKIVEPDPPVLNMMASIGCEVAQFIKRKRAETALRESQQHLHWALQAAHMGTWTNDIHDGRVRWSPELEAMFGLAPGSFAGTEEAFFDLVHPEDRATVRRIVAEAVESGREYEVEFRTAARGREGDERWIYGRGQAFHDSDGKPLRVAGIAMDITARRRAERALHESEARFRAMADAAPVMIWVVGSDGRCEYVNQRWLEFTGRCAGDCLGDAWTGDLHPDDAVRFRQTFNAALDSRAQFRAEYRMRRYDGTYRWILASGTPRFGPGGGFIGYIGSGADVSDLKDAELSLRARARHQRAVARVASCAMSGGDLPALLDETVMHVSRALHLTRAAIFEADGPGGTLAMRAGVGWPHDAAAQRAHLSEASAVLGEQDSLRRAILKSGTLVVESWEREPRFARPSLLDERHAGAMLAARIPAAHAAFGVLAAFANQPRAFTRDEINFIEAVANVLGAAIAGHRAAGELDQYREHLETLVAERSAALARSHEQLRSAERLASLGTLAAGIGHDLGNLVLPTLCRLDYLSTQVLPEKAQEELSAVRQAMVHLRQLSGGLRLLALDPEDPNASSGFTRLQSWWDESGSLLRKAVPKTVQIEVDLDEDAPPIAVAPHQFTQAVFNLVLNAADAIGERPGNIDIWCRVPPDGRSVIFGVTDTGHGMTEEVRRHALEPFFTTKRRTLSTGLGLTFVHGMVQAAGGSIDLRSRVGAGTTVQMTLPAYLSVSELDDAGPRTARLSLGDARIAACARALLTAAGYAICEDGQPDDNNEAHLWIVDPSCPHEEIRRFIAGDSGGRRVIMVGRPESPPREAGIESNFRIVEGSYSALRRALQGESTLTTGATTC